MAKPQICTSCHTMGTGKSVMRGSLGMELVLWMCFGIGIVYSVWRHTTRQTVCAACRQPTLIPLHSPHGQKIRASLAVASVLALACLASAPAHALEHCTRAPIGAGPALGPVVCTEVQSDRGTVIAVRQAHDRRASRTDAAPAPTDPPMAPPVGSIITMDPTGFSRRGTEAGDPRRFCGEDTACQQWYITHTYIAQDGAVRLKTPSRSHRYWDRRGTVTGPKRGGVFVKVR